MGIFDKINGKNIEQKVSEYSEIYGEVLLGVHRDVKSLESKVQTLSAVLVSDDGQMPSNDRSIRFQSSVAHWGGPAPAQYDQIWIGTARLRRGALD